MVRFVCPHCSRTISAADEHAGKQAPCPGCKNRVTVPAPEQAPRPRPSDITEQPRPAPVRAKPTTAAKPNEAVRSRPAHLGRASRRDEDDEVVDVEVVEDEDEVVEAEVIEEEEPERKPRRRRRKRPRTGPYANCPNCGERGDAYRVSWTLWGGFVGPWVLTHVRCNSCDTTYNGKTGKDNTLGIVLWIVIPAAIGLMLGVLGFVFEVFGK